MLYIEQVFKKSVTTIPVNSILTKVKITHLNSNGS